jgi:hypothetical protein
MLGRLIRGEMMWDKMTTINPAALAQSALGVVVGRDLLGRRELDEMTIPELEARVKMNEERLRLARKIGWLGGFGGGIVGVLGVAKMIR